MKTYASIIQRIESIRTMTDAKVKELEAEAQQILDEERAGVILRIQEAIEYYGITEAELHRKPTRRKVAAAPKPKKQSPRKKSKPRPVKFADGKGNTWAGGGSTPRWMQAYMENGAKREDFLVKPQEPSEDSVVH